MTHSESVAVEHIAWRRRTGETWPAIYAEAEDALATVGMAMTGEIDTAWQAERAGELRTRQERGINDERPVGGNRSGRSNRKHEDTCRG